MKTLMGVITSRSVVFTARWLLGIVFIVSALGKITNPSEFANQVAAYRLLPIHEVNSFAMVLPWIEFLTGLSLVNGVAQKSGALLAGIMNMIFISAAASAMARGLSIECGCITIAKSRVGWELIARDSVFLALSAIVLLAPRSPEK